MTVKPARTEDAFPAYVGGGATKAKAFYEASQLQQHAPCMVTACDRGGHKITEQLATGQTYDQVIKHRSEIFAEFRAQHPDCQVYFDWKGQARR